MAEVYIITKNTRYLDGPQIKVNNRTCLICGSGFRIEDIRRAYLPDNNACQDCQFWYEKWLSRDAPTSIRVNGNQYTLTPKKALTRHVVQSGKHVYTDCLSHNGKIPGTWVVLGLTDNAEFGDGHVEL